MTLTTKQTGAWVGKSLFRKEDKRLLAGAGNFTDDFVAVNALYCGIIRSPHPHARILRVDTSPALSIPGVVAAISGAEAKAYWNPYPPTWESPYVRQPRSYPLAVDKVHFQGEPVAAIVAESRSIAEDALSAVLVEYEELPALTSVADALGENGKEPETLLYENWPDNIQCTWPFSIGDLDAAFSAADLVVKERLSSQRYSTMPLETRTVCAEFNAIESYLTVRVSTQIPHHARGNFAQMFNLPEANVRVIVPDVGGGFGGKLALDIEYVPVLMALITKRPVKWFETRTEWITAGPHARDFVCDVEAAFKNDGTLLALRNHIVADMGCDGAERAGGLGMPVMAGTYMPGGYKLENYSMYVQCVVTNKAPYGACRGYGKDIANMGMERVLDQAAYQLGIDPLAIRRHNLIDTYPHQICTGPIIESGSLLEALSKLEEMMDIQSLRERQLAARTQGRYLGIATVSYIEPSGGSIPNSMYQNYESATVRVAQDGSVRVFTGIPSLGQGIQTAMAQVVADRLGCSPNDVRVTWGDTESVPFGLGAYSGRGASYGMSAVAHASDKIREKVLIAAANLLEANVADLLMENGSIFVPSTPGASTKAVTLAEVAHAVYFYPGAEAVLIGVEDPSLEATSVWRHPATNWNPDELGRVQLYTSHPGGAQGALVEVDVETGQLRVERIWMVADHGVLIHPPSVDGQIVGGCIQQLGGTLFESVHYDEHGNVLTKTLQSYGLPNIMSAPPVEIAHIETPLPNTPIGAKGAGEGGCMATTTVLMAAVEDALRPFGAKVMRSPLTPWEVLRCIAEGKAGIPDRDDQVLLL